MVPNPSPISRERQLEFAKIWHKVFSSNLRYVVQSIQEQGEVDPAQVGDHGACLLGQWLDHQPETLRTLPAFAELVKVHRRYHDTARDLATAYLAGQTREVDALIDGPFQTLSDAVMDQIGALGMALADAGIFVPRFEEAPRQTRPTIWDVSLEVGIPAIDQRHQAIAALIDELAVSDDLVCCPTEDQHFLTTLTTLIEHDIAHERDYFRDQRLEPATLAAHEADHQWVLDYIRTISDNIASGAPLPLADIGRDLGKWFVEHLITHDMELQRG